MAKIAQQTRAGTAMLVRRVLIPCPVTGLSVDTGQELTAIPSMGRTFQLLVDCMECGQDHAWQLEDAVLEPLGDEFAMAAADAVAA